MQTPKQDCPHCIGILLPQTLSWAVLIDIKRLVWNKYSNNLFNKHNDI